ncbi:MAG TPA: DUF4129 domain-containing protein [Solirubrobacteraceae bacterium]|nr:DUF4129 domain-containing protein [Solirubrobacteraceae bacterium]
MNATAAQGPTIALFVALTGLGIVMLGALFGVAWSGRRRKDDPPEPEPTRVELPWTAKLIGVLLLVAMGAALVAAAVVGARSTRTTRQLGGGVLGAPRSPGLGPGRTTGGFVVPSWLPWVALGLVALAAAAGLLALWLSRDRFSRQAREPDATGAAVAAAIDALDADSDPRRGVIAAYGAMHRTLGDYGVVHSPAEAPREYLRRVLLQRGATEDEATTLTGLFEEARYSTHPIPERLRGLALSALRSLQARLGAEGAK